MNGEEIILLATIYDHLLIQLLAKPPRADADEEDGEGEQGEKVWIEFR